LDLPVTITLTGWFEDEMLAVLQEQIAGFEAANPDLRVEIALAAADYERRREQLLADLESGDTSVDIYVLGDTWLAEFAAGGWLTPLDDSTQAYGIRMDGFLASTALTSNIGDQTMALPWTADGGLLYYRRDLLSKHSVTPPSTWHDLQDTALDVKRQEGLPHGYVWQGAAYEGLTCNTLEHVWAHGGDVLDADGNAIFDSVESRAALRQMSDLIASGASPAEVTSFREGTALRTFQEGNAVFLRHWSRIWNLLQDDDSPLAGHVGIAPLPAACLFGESLALSSHSLYPEQAFRLMAFLVGYDQQLQLARDLGQPPALEAVYHDAELLEAAPAFADLFDALSATRPRPRTAAYREVSEAIHVPVNRMLQGEQDPDQTAQTVQAQIESALDRQQ
jgi:multiple sugar transport system substrate-binding protein